MSRLLVLSDDRIAAELRRAEEQGQAHAAYRRELWRLGARCGVGYAIGVAVAFSSLSLTGDNAQMALWGGLLIGNGAILIFWLTLWARDVL